MDDEIFALATRLKPVVSEAMGSDVDIFSLTRLSGGASRETWRCTATTRGEDTDLILQRGRVVTAGAGGSSAGMHAEGIVLRAVEAAGVPVAHAYAFDGGVEKLGAPFLLTSFVAGETIARKIQRDAVYAPARDVLVADLGAAAAKLHSVPLDAVAHLNVVDQVEQYRMVLDALGHAHPAFELGFRFLESNRPTASATALVHGDFRLGNIIVGSTALAAVIDWELAHLGDPMEDLGWLCVRAWRFGGRLPVAGLGTYRELFDAYEQAGGAKVDPEGVRWWEILGTLKWGIMCIMQANAHLSGLSRSVELAAIGRRVCENEYDLLALLS